MEYFSLGEREVLLSREVLLRLLHVQKFLWLISNSGAEEAKAAGLCNPPAATDTVSLQCRAPGGCTIWACRSFSPDVWGFFLVTVIFSIWGEAD